MRLLLEWASDGDHTREGIRIKVSLPQEEIAQLIGTSRETVTPGAQRIPREKICAAPWFHAAPSTTPAWKECSKLKGKSSPPTLLSSPPLVRKPGLPALLYRPQAEA